jgi:hypothetical protein
MNIGVRMHCYRVRKPKLELKERSWFLKTERRDCCKSFKERNKSASKGMDPELLQRLSVRLQETKSRIIL